MHLIAYISEYTGKDNAPRDLKDIEKTAKEKNPLRDITGVLFYHGGNFMQIIEGPQANLYALMSELVQDERHKNVEILIDEAVDKRGFSDWNMDGFNLTDDDSLDRDALKKIGDSYKMNIIPRSDSLALYYKTHIENKIMPKDKPNVNF